MDCSGPWPLWHEAPKTWLHTSEYASLSLARLSVDVGERLCCLISIPLPSIMGTGASVVDASPLTGDGTAALQPQMVLWARTGSTHPVLLPLHSPPGDTVVRRKPTSLSAPLQRKEEFSLFTGPDDLCKVKISPQLLLATQRFLSRGESDGGSCLSSPLHLHGSGQPPHAFPVPLNMAGLCHQLQWCGLARLCV